MKRILPRFFILLLLLTSSVASWAQLTSLEAGAVYRFVNARTGDRSLRANGAADVHVKATDANDKAQEWYVTKDGDYYVLRNLAYGKYLKGNGQSSAWSMTDDYSHNYNKFELCVSNSTYNTLHTYGLGDYAYMHDDNNGDNGGYNVVGWLNGDSNIGSHWTITKVNYTRDEIDALLEAVPTVAEVEVYEANIAELFTDDACLAPAYSSLAAAKATQAYAALPGGLQAMVDKVYGGEWTEENADASKEAWDTEHAMKFRVQMYEPYSIAGDITSWLGVNAHANNDNPTGIYMPAAGSLYVMVEGEIEEGASLRIINGGSNWRIGDATSGGYALTSGLNVITYPDATGQLYICYNVDTYNPDGTDAATRFPHRLSEYEPLKIHIEGGAITGFYNACGDFRATAADGSDNLWKTITGDNVDNDTDWTYLEERANLDVIPVVGHRQILLFQFEDVDGNKGMKNLMTETLEVPAKPYSRTGVWDEYNMGLDTGNAKINIMMEAWDRIMYSQMATMGLVSKSQMAFMNDMYPRWTAEGTAAEIYDYENASDLDGKSYQEFCGVDYSEVFNHHGVALGTTSGYMYGGWDHCGYHINTFGSIISKIANEAGPTWGPAHEIGHQHQGIFNLNGQTEVTNNFFANVAVWYMGMGTSRYNGSQGNLENVLAAFNTLGGDAYTNNIWALTHMYYRLWLYYHLAGNNTQFWPRLFELCRQERIQNGTTISGDQSLLRFYKHACDAAGEDLTEFFRAHGYLEVMDGRLVGDYTNAVYNQTQEMVDEAIAYVKAKNYPANYAVLLVNDGTSETTLQHNGTDKRALWDGSASAELGSVTDFIDGGTPVGSYTATASADGVVTMTGEGGVGFLVFDGNGELVSFSNNTTFALGDEAVEAIMTGSATFVAVDAGNNTAEVEIDLTAMQKTLLGTLIERVKETVVGKVDDTYTKIGFYKSVAVADLVNALEYAEGIYATSSGYEGAYDLLYAEYSKLLANSDARIPFNSSLTYVITNRGNSSLTMYLNDSKTVKTGTSVDCTDPTARWQFKETGTAGVYNIYNMSGYYCPAIAQSTTMTATTAPADNALYTLQEMEDGVWAIRLSPAAGYTNFHSDASWNVVGWETGNAASRWYLTAVEPDATLADLADLEVYMGKTQELLDEVMGNVTFTKGDALALQTTAEDAQYYIWTNAQSEAEGPIANLVDGATNNFFHTDYSGGEVTSGSHYVAVDLGVGNTLPRFTFGHTTRAGALADFPKSVDVYGSDDNVTYKYIGSATGMPQTASTAWESDGIMVSSHRYLRFNVHANRGYWHMAEFDIVPVTGFTATVNEAYSGNINLATLQAAYEALLNGRSVATEILPTTDDIQARLSSLKAAYEALYAEYEAIVAARKASLASLVATTTELIDKVGTVQLALETPVELTASNLYCNAPYTASNNNDYSLDYVSKLTDGDVTTYLHTDYNVGYTDALPHYLRVDLGDGSTVTKFRFSYSTRDNGNNCPTTIVVEGCNEPEGTYTAIATLTTADGLPNPGENTAGGVAESFTSQVMTMDGAYRYVRFRVTAVEGGDAKYFVLSEFAISTVTEVIVDIFDAYQGTVSDDLLLATVLVTNSSDNMSNNALVRSVPLLDAQIADQQAAYDALYDAFSATLMPMAGKFYALRCCYQDRYVYVNATNRMQWDAQYDSSSSRAVWLFNKAGEESDRFCMKSLHTGGSLMALSENAQAVMGEEGADVIVSPSEDYEGAVVFAVGDNGLGLHSHGSDGRVIGYSNIAEANHYLLEEVAAEDIHHDVTMAAEYSSVMLSYNTIVPSGVTAYIATGIDGGRVTLVSIAEEGGVLPANTPVILYRSDDETVKRFCYTDEAATVDTSLSLLDGRLCDDLIECADGYRYYKLLLSDGKAKMYHMYEEYAADGTFGPDDIYKKSDDGGYIKCSANKIYMVLSESEAAMTMYDVRADGATGIAEIEDATADEVMYDLQGRKVNGVVAPGFYILNGKKVFVE